MILHFDGKGVREQLCPPCVMGLYSHVYPKLVGKTETAPQRALWEPPEALAGAGVRGCAAAGGLGGHSQAGGAACGAGECR